MQPERKSLAAWLPCAERLRRIIADNGDSQITVAAAAGITQAYLSFLLSPGTSGKTPSLDCVLRLASALRVEPSSFLPTLRELKPLYPRDGK